MIDAAIAVTQELKRIRNRANLTQVDLAERMGTKQASIARMESNTRGAFSLKRIADYAIACGYIPCSLCDIEEIRVGIPPVFHCIPLEDARQFVIAHPQETMSWHRYVRWKSAQILKELEPPQQYLQTNWLSCNYSRGALS